MTYQLNITSSSGQSVLASTMTFDPSTARMEITDSSVDQSAPGALSLHGLNAFRLLCLAELFIARALGIKGIDPQDEIDSLKLENARLRAENSALRSPINPDTITP